MECCKTLAIPFEYYKFSTDDLNFYMMRGAEFVTTDKGPFMILNLSCPNLTEKGCGIYGDRPRICKDYDGREVPFMRYRCKWFELEV